MNETYTLINIIKTAHEYVEKSPSESARAHRIATLTSYVRDLTSYTLHFGGECPITSDEQNVEVIYRDGDKYKDTFWKYEAIWLHDNHPKDILAYRVIDPPKPKVDRSLRGHIMVKHDGLATEAWGGPMGINLNATTHTQTFVSWPSVESAGWEVYKP